MFQGGVYYLLTSCTSKDQLFVGWFTVRRLEGATQTIRIVYNNAH